jgi:hypothetical protein
MTSPPRTRRSRTRKAALSAVLAATLSAGGATAWALDRFVIQHVEISDVDAYEASQSGTTTAGSTSGSAASDGTASTAATDSVTTAGDDGVKAYGTLTVSAGKVTVTKSEEGLEAQHIAVGGGNVKVTANDDGVNASGSTGSADQGAGFGMGPGGGGQEAGDYSVKVSGGKLTINAEGDGLDSNGNASVTGGTVVVNGPTGDGNGALDVNGELTVDGGTVAAAGSAGMAVTPSASSGQSGVQVTFGSAVPAGTVVQVAGSSGPVTTFVTAKATASLVISAKGFTAGEEYTVYTGGTADVDAGLGSGSLDGASEFGTVAAGQYTQSMGPGGH